LVIRSADLLSRLTALLLADNKPGGELNCRETVGFSMYSLMSSPCGELPPSVLAPP